MRILIADDEAVSLRLLAGTVSKWGYDVVTARDGSQASEILAGENAPRLAILDWMMPGKDGIDICAEIRKNNAEPYIYILLLTAKAEKEDIIEGMGAGADDYIVKPCDPHELHVRLRAGRRIVELQDELIAARERLRFQATHDSLTGLWNRAAAAEVLEKERSRSVRHHIPLTVIMADIDKFKKINDTCGHDAGDAVIRYVAARMNADSRRYDTVARYGGEEFLIIVPGCSPTDGHSLAERIRRSIASANVRHREHSIPVTVSMGVAALHPDNPTDIDNLIKRADTALYQAKESGRNRVCRAEEA